MEIIVICACPIMLGRVRASLTSIGADDILVSVHDGKSVLNYIEETTAERSLLVFYCKPFFAEADYASIKELSEVVQQRGIIVAIGSAADSNQILQVIRQGVADYLDLHVDFDQEMNELIERFQKKHAKARNKCRIYSFFNPEGSFDASLLAVNVATSIAHKHNNCGLLDFQFQGGVHSHLLNVNPRYTLHSIADKLQQLDAKIFDHLLVELDSGLHLLAAPEPLADGQTYKYSEELINKVIHFASARFTHIAIDLGKAVESIQANIISLSDRVIITLRPNVVSLYRTIRLLDYLKLQNYPESHIHIVVNNTDQHHALPFSKLNEVLGHPITHHFPADIGNQNKSINLGVPLVQCAPNSKLARKIIDFTQELVLGQQPLTHKHVTVLKPFISAARRFMQLF